MDGPEEMWLGGDLACPLLRQDSPWHQTVHVAMGSAGLIPGVQDLDATEWAPQVLAAALEQCLAGHPPAQRAEGAFGRQDECIDLMRARQDAGAIWHGQELGLAVFDPPRLGPGLTLGAVTMAA
jgi:hypothetical protein